FMNLKVENRYIAVQEAIKRYILENKLKPGDRLPTEQELTELLGVSRTSLREALKSLQALGIIEIKPGEGTIVRAFNFDPILKSLLYNLIFESTELFEILQVREALELHFLKQTIERITPEELLSLEKILLNMKEKAQKGQLFDEEDAAFHRLLFVPVKNSLLLSLLDIFWEVLHRLREPIEVERDPLGSFERHRKLFNAVKGRDIEKACSFLVDHFLSIRKRVEKAMGKK
ncbi:MAG: FadR/GntR family transcriptional regulator, partial [Candidatus Caldatribacteriaceae bacterium]